MASFDTAPSGSCTECPSLYIIDTGLSVRHPSEAGRSGRILIGDTTGQHLKTLVAGQRVPDGLDLSVYANKLFWTVMGFPDDNDGAVYSCNIQDGNELAEIVPRGAVHTPKQLFVDSKLAKVYFCDREGLRIWRCNFDGSDLEVLVQTGDWLIENQKRDQTRWCVGISVSHSTGKFYWTQKGPSKGFKGRIFQANIKFAEGENASNRTDIECIFQNLPEPIDLAFDDVHWLLYWTDRGELPFGNSVNRASVSHIEPIRDANVTSLPGRDYELVARNLHEAIGIKLDLENCHFYATDLGGTVYRFDLNGGNRTKLYDEESSAFAGLAIL